MLKQSLVDAYKITVKNNGFTYIELCDITGLSQSQIANILKRDGQKVSIEKMEAGLLKLGFGISVEFYEIQE